MEDDFDEEIIEPLDEEVKPPDIHKFCAMLEEAWRTVPMTNFALMLNEVFAGYNLMELTNEEQEELLNEFIFRNM